jgi:peptidoglycan/LPS O-acetylase OafA/YrhL
MPLPGSACVSQNNETRAREVRSEHLPTLDGWRGLAILTVLLGHGQLAISPPEYSQIAFFRAFNGFGGYGVELFFAISGLLICYKLGTERVATGRLDLMQFYGRRIFRLLPSAVFYILCICLLAAFGLIIVTAGEIFASLFFFRNYWSSFQMPRGHYTSHFWSLSVEEQFYLVIPFAIAMVRWRTLFYSLPLVCFAVALWRGLESHYGLTTTLFPQLVADTGRTDLCIDHLIWGAWFGLILANHQGREKLRRLIGPAWVQGALLLAFLALITLPIPARKIWIASLTPALLVSTILNPSTWLGFLLEKRLLAWTGRISYSLYLWQQLFLLQIGIPESEFAQWPVRLFQNFPLGLPATFLAAALSYYLIEQPLRRRGYRWLRSS